MNLVFKLMSGTSISSPLLDVVSLTCKFLSMALTFDCFAAMHFNGNRPQIDFIRTCNLRVDLSYVRHLRRIVGMTRMEFLCMSNDRSDEKE
ncbi:hypothetical protein T11_2903 [Trichinella zimbabwensis]|uniref:Uncharacterized protein n=1 Tax=Trichinella zimbabwensis TaxID=268475 RepID=A0A0V1HGM1_9BILA|nr:hypothetical protein T11_2903 [Trichinella zimbabwensis]